jgi:hypothetical protein
MKHIFRKVSAIALAMTIMLASCSQEGDVNLSSDSANAQAVSTTPASMMSRGVTLRTVTNMEDFAYNHVLIAQEMYNLIENTTYTFDANADANIKAAKNETELVNTLKGYGMNETDAKDYIGYTKLAQTNITNLITADKNFASKSQADKESAITIAIRGQHQLLPIQPIDENPGYISERERTCKEQFWFDRNACNEDYAINMGLCVVASVLGAGWGGLVATAGVMIMQDRCLSRANANYKECLK